MKKPKDFINKSDNEFVDISSELYRTYTFPNKEKVIIQKPLKLSVSKNGHRVWDVQNKSHYIPIGWIHLEWQVEEGKPNFVK